jgi:trimeric autotransporter adhesin
MHPRNRVLIVATAIVCAVAAGGAVLAKAAGPAATLTLTTSVASGTAPVSLTLTVTVSGPNLMGSILFKDGTSTLGTAPLTRSQAVLSATLGVGIHRLVAVYQGTGSATDSPVVNVIVDNTLACR